MRHKIQSLHKFRWFSFLFCFAIVVAGAFCSIAAYVFFVVFCFWWIQSALTKYEMIRAIRANNLLLFFFVFAIRPSFLFDWFAHFLRVSQQQQIRKKQEKRTNGTGKKEQNIYIERTNGSRWYIDMIDMTKCRWFASSNFRALEWNRLNDVCSS